MITTLHLPINREIKEKAENVAREQGYSSLQEVLRVFVASLAKKEIKSAFINTEAVELLNSDQESYLNIRENDTRHAVY